MKNLKPVKNDRRRREMQVIRKLKAEISNDNLTLTKVDKGNITVILSIR